MPTTQILYFASLRDRIGRAEEHVELPPQVRTVRALLAWLQGREAAFALLAEQGRTVRMAVNQEFAGPDDRGAPGSVIAVFRRVPGG